MAIVPTQIFNIKKTHPFNDIMGKNKNYSKDSRLFSSNKDLSPWSMLIRG